MKIGCCADMDRYDELCELGYDCIELPGIALARMNEKEINQVKNRLAANRTKCDVLNFFCDSSLKLLGPDYSERKCLLYVQDLCRKAAVLGVHCIGVGAPESRKIPEGFDRERAKMQCTRFLELAALEAEKYGIEILFEPVNRYYCNFMNTLKETAAFLEPMKEFHVGMVLDFCHMYLMEEGLDEIEKALPYIRHVHIGHQVKDGPRYHLTEEDRTWVTKAVRKLLKLGYEGDISFEVGPREDFRKEAEGSLHLLKDILASADISL